MGGESQGRTSSVGSGAGAVPKPKCVMCNKLANKDTVQCSGCHVWLHFKCRWGLNNFDGSWLNHDFVKVYCNSCKDLPPPPCDDAMSLVQQVSEKVDALAAKLEPILSPDIEAQAVQQKTWADVAAAKAIKDAKLATSENVKQLVTAQVERLSVNVTADIVAENRQVQEDTMLRRSAVLSGIGESPDDLREVRKLCGFLDPGANVTEVFRMGQRSKKQDPKPRLLKIHFASSHCQKSVLNEARRLKSPASEWQNVYIRRSLSSAELKQFNDLRTRCV